MIAQETRQATTERLRASLRISNQLPPHDGQNHTVVGVPRPDQTYPVYFTFIGNPSKAHIEKTIRDTFAMEAEARKIHPHNWRLPQSVERRPWWYSDIILAKGRPQKVVDTAPAPVVE